MAPLLETPVTGGSSRVPWQVGGPGGTNQVCPAHSCFSSLPSLIRASVSLPGKSGFAAVCVNKKNCLVFLLHPEGLLVLLHPPKLCGPLGMDQHSGFPRELPHPKERGKGPSWGSAGASRASLRACLGGTCDKPELLGPQQILGEFCAFQSLELSLDSFVLPNTITWGCGSPQT